MPCSCRRRRRKRKRRRRRRGLICWCSRLAPDRRHSTKRGDDTDSQRKEGMPWRGRRRTRRRRKEERIYL